MKLKEVDDEFEDNFAESVGMNKFFLLLLLIFLVEDIVGFVIEFYPYRLSILFLERSLRLRLGIFAADFVAVLVAFNLFFDNVYLMKI